MNETFVGEWKNSVRSGFGKYVDKLNQVVYIGSFRDGKWHGHGILEKKDESIYVGEFKEDKRHGMGKITTSNWTYDGEWKEGLITGVGKVFEDDGSEYIGRFY